MPALAQHVIDDITLRLRRYLATLGTYGEPQFIDAGGSAAVYRVESEAGLRALKVFNPVFLNGPSGDAERRRLQVQRRLINHNCATLVQTYRVDEAEGTAFLEMEFNPWPALTKLLPDVPDEAVERLITQLVEAVRFLEAKGIVHRDIKPENIHVSPDFKQLKLLDLGVARDIEPGGAEDAAITDHGNLRPFLATAQYSSPEYLFRLDEPSAKLWKGLDIYQVGAVLHDLIMKKPLFQHEMNLGNRWLVARAVLTKQPSFADEQPGRLSNLKALAARCLVKDLDARLQQVGWDDFVLEGANDPLKALEARLKKHSAKGGALAQISARERLEFDRSEFTKRFIGRVRSELTSTCGTLVPCVAQIPAQGALQVARLCFSPSGQALTIECQLAMEWQPEIYERTVNIYLLSQLQFPGLDDKNAAPTKKLISTATISEAEDETVQGVAGMLAKCIMLALDLIDTAPDPKSLHGTDLLLEKSNGEKE